MRATGTATLSHGAIGQWRSRSHRCRHAGRERFELLPRIKKLRPDCRSFVMSAQNTFMTAIKASERGAYDYLPKPFDLKRTRVDRRTGDERAKGRVKVDATGAGGHAPRGARRPCRKFIAPLRDSCRRTTVMVSGESGTEKELVARALHDWQAKKGPFVAINMAAIPRDLIESELFGHEGAHSPAQTPVRRAVRTGRGRHAFLDEIGDMPMWRRRPGFCTYQQSIHAALTHPIDRIYGHGPTRDPPG